MLCPGRRRAGSSRLHPTIQFVRHRNLAITVLLAACGRASTGDVTFGAAGPWDDPNGKMDHQGIELAVDEINAQPTWRTHPLRVIYRNDGADGVKATQIAKEFLDSSNVVAVVGHVNSGAMVAAAKIYDRGLPAVATSASSPNLSGISRWTFRVISSDSMNGVELGRFVSQLGRRRAAILYENNSYGRGLAAAFRRGFSGGVVDMDPISDAGDQDFDAYLSFFAQQRPDLVFVASTAKSGKAFLRQARSRRLASDIAAGDGWTALASDTALMDGVYVGAPFSAEDSRPEVRQFVEAFRRKFGVTPESHAALAYDATKLLAQAVLQVGADRAKVRDYLAHIDESQAFHGVTGNIRFNQAGDPVGKSIVVTRARHGALVPEKGE